VKKTRSHTTDWPQIDRFLQSAERKLVTARKILEFDEEASLQQAYEAMLRASLAFIFSYGQRVRSQPGHHIAIIEFVQERLGKEHAGLLILFDHLRRKRNLVLYDDSGFVSLHEAEEALNTAHAYLELLRGRIERRRAEAQH
jgi:uncharacterized protein (UPF0332 family)